ncbi:universal stress protein [Actinacidiphila oryziradicis]|uniref:Universal stress protein n=1 Tax=Actinacidiphila oryziradicis TaxID=2571141 RepID=A0A4U0S0V5_9ACTN|nr:universal stress protein [Actinacidiphila oryziradicis]TKA01703.1 universal stress protein [Actinacidiphila oryziradicis]
MDETGSGRIVVGVSGSLGSLAALHRAVAEARDTGAEVLAVLAWEPAGGEFAYRRAPSPPLLTEGRRLAKERLRTAMDTAFGASWSAGRLRAQAICGTPGEALVQTADREDDLLVVGAGQRGLLRRALRRSTSRYCLAHATCPVLAVPPSPLQRDLATVHRRNTWWLPLHPRRLGEDTPQLPRG